MNTDECNTDERGTSKYLWFGPALFFSVLIVVIVFFVWFLRP